MLEEIQFFFHCHGYVSKASSLLGLVKDCRTVEQLNKQTFFFFFFFLSQLCFSTWYQSAESMAWRSPAINMVRQSTQLGGNENQVGAANHPPNPIPIPIPIPIPTVDQAVFDPNDRKNPLYLHPNESPALQLVSVQLEGRSNYHPWARAMEMALRSKNKMSIVNGTMVIPNTTDARYYYWDQCNTMVLSWILRAVSPTVGRGVLWIDTAEGVWKDLKKRFSQQDVLRIAEIQAEIYQTKQGNSSINEYFTQLKLLWDELFILRPVPCCERPLNCECGSKLSEKVKMHLENDMLSSFLIGLNENYTSTNNQIMLMKPLPDVGIQTTEAGILETDPPITQESYKRFLEFMQREKTSNTPLDCQCSSKMCSIFLIVEIIIIIMC
ncbi:uncharacterized protein LOC116030825 isoform X1 [Ipomoea triloba]|uniref:uncharacterized protein LOC116030825 isoform X1 n=1 Tax=Ipomoea triloba TaxID=35885 RepID=UPI00125DA330|nr:uncharacterized protein LOC116030825 isoform X1 [Ipomoea triloba]